MHISHEWTGELCMVHYGKASFLKLWYSGKTGPDPTAATVAFLLYVHVKGNKILIFIFSVVLLSPHGFFLTLASDVMMMLT